MIEKEEEKVEEWHSPYFKRLSSRENEDQNISLSRCLDKEYEDNTHSNSKPEAPAAAAPDDHWGNRVVNLFSPVFRLFGATETAVPPSSSATGLRKSILTESSCNSSNNP